MTRPQSILRLREGVVWYGVKLPWTLIIIPVGLLFEFILSLPFALLCRLDERRR